VHLPEFLALMQRIAPLELAEEWDNVGLLLAPTTSRPLSRALLTVDLTSQVLEEAIELGVEALVAYHPPIFSGLKRLNPDVARDQMLLRVIERGIVVYSPHTALDAVPGGVNDWLAEAFSVASKEPLVARPGTPNTGQGRFLKLSEPLSLAEALLLLKRHLGLPTLRVARAAGKERSIETVALCAGAGGSLVMGRAADLLLTGELRHHDVLHAVERGTHVVLTEHTHSERGYLPRLRERMQTEAPITVFVSSRDDDPLRFV
jgi:dinuclear metal center YbgI/SA1388 family protein